MADTATGRCNDTCGCPMPCPGGVTCMSVSFSRATVAEEGLGMAEAEAAYGDVEHGLVGREAAIQALINTIIQLHFEKTLEKKRAVDLQKEELWRLFLLFFLFLFLVLSTEVQSPPSRLQCRHCWAPIGLLSLGHLVFYVSVVQTLRCINGFKYQRRCHKLTLALATDRLKQLKMRSGGDTAADFEIHYREPPESYLGKFKRNWVLHFGFLICTFGFMVSASVVVLCF